MIKNILAVGDSFTFGEELENPTNGYSYLLGKRIGAKVNNKAKPGTGNTQIIRTVIDHVSLNRPIVLDPVDLVIVGWSSPGRMEFADALGLHDIWPGYSGEVTSWRSTLLEYINKHHDVEYIYQQHLLNIIQLQHFLTQQNIKYIMLDTIGNEYYRYTSYDKMQPLANLVDPTYYLGWKTAEGMTTWAKKSKCGPGGHFLEDGHKEVANKLYEYIRNLGWVS